MTTVPQQRLFLSLVFGAVALGATNRGWCQIPVGLDGTPTITFSSNATLPATEWATDSNGFGATASGTFRTPAEIDAGAQTFEQSAFSTALTRTSAEGTALDARHNIAGGFLLTRPAAVAAVALKATLRNVSGTSIYQITVSYDFGRPGISTANAEELPGHRAYFSLTGVQNSWQLIPEFSGLTTGGPVSATLILGEWPHDASLYLLWADDNAVTNPEGTNTIDNFTVSDVIHVDPTLLVITNPLQSITVTERAPAVFNVGVEGFPRNFYWFSNNIQVVGNNQSTFTIASAAYPANHNAQIYVVASNGMNVVTSAVVTLTVVPDSTAPTVVSAIGELDPTQVTVRFSEAIDPSANEESFTVFLTDGDPAGGDALLTTSVTFIDSNATVIITTESRTAGANYSLRVQQVFDASSGHNPIAPNPTIVSIRPMLQLIGLDTDNEWKYSLGSDLTGTGWESTGFDDSAWPSGEAPLGLDSSAGTGAQPEIRTTIPYTAQSEPVYFRRHFFFPAFTNGALLTLRHLAEDGAIYYLNGQEVFRTNVPPGPVTFTTRAVASVAEPTPVSGPFQLAITNLVPGDNVLAVCVVQVGAASADVAFTAEIIANIQMFPPQLPPLVRMYITPGTTAGEWSVAWTGLGILQQSEALDNSGGGWANVTGNPNPYIFTPLPNTKRFFRVR